MREHGKAQQKKSERHEKTPHPEVDDEHDTSVGDPVAERGKGLSGPASQAATGEPVAALWTPRGWTRQAR
ncbi:hypothetical protein GCM10010303_67540 [Streptomyces purpurascens]|nr:hypothetical protein GCM10010303_67540 [Streptomyces purpurascens]